VIVSGAKHVRFYATQAAQSEMLRVTRHVAKDLTRSKAERNYSRKYRYAFELSREAE